MIKELSISNFQSHKETTLEFHEGVNVIVGSSDSGKTAILRALRWLIWNRPSGEAFRSDWGGETEVRLETEVGIISRYKDKKDKYTARLKGLLTEVVFEAFGTSVPKEIQDALNISDINLQQQLDQPFLLTETPGAVAQHFNKVARLDKIDLGLQNVQRAIRELEQDIKFQSGQLTSQEEALQGYLHLDKFEAEVEVLEGMENALQAKESSRKRLSGYIIDYEDTVEEIKEQEEIIKDEKLVNSTLQLYEDRAILDEKQVKLERLVIKIKKVQDDIKEQEQVLRLEEQVDSILLLFEKVVTLEETHDKLRYLIGRITTTTKDKEWAGLNLNSFQEKFDKEMPDICPLCNQPIKKK